MSLDNVVIKSGGTMPAKNEHASKWRVLFAKMAVGEFFEASNDSDRRAALTSAKRLGFKVRSRKTDNGKYEVWRVE